MANNKCFFILTLCLAHLPHHIFSAFVPYARSSGKETAVNIAVLEGSMHRGQPASAEEKKMQERKALKAHLFSQQPEVFMYECSICKASTLFPRAQQAIKHVAESHLEQKECAFCYCPSREQSMVDHYLQEHYSQLLGYIRKIKLPVY
jgi:hypothetical protein